MADFVFNIAKGKVARYADLPDANDALIVVILKLAGVESDATLKDYDNLSVILAAANDECDFTGYSRKTLASVTSTVDDTNDRMDTDAADPSAYTNSGGSSQAASKLLVVWDGDTTGGSDTNIVPLTAHDCAITFDIGVATTIAFATAGFFRAS
jgi:hypothetical protein